VFAWLWFGACGMGCSIFSNLYLVRDVLDFIHKTNEPAILLTLDCVDHHFMSRALSKFRFGPSFCHWVFFYAHALSHILINGAPSHSPLRR